MKHLLNIIIPSLICFCLLFFPKISFGIYPLIFGLIIGLFNANKTKGLHSLIIILLSVILSYTVFYISYFSMIPIGFLLNALFENVLNDEIIGVLVFFISPYIIAPLIMFYFYKLLFKINTTKLGNIIIIISVLLIVIQWCFFYYLKLNTNSINSFISWQVIMALGIQIMIYQDRLINKE